METGSLILYNDNVNSFEWVIESLIEVCNHNVFQAEQCALLVHKTGKCNIKTGNKLELVSYRKELNKRGLKIKIV